MPDQPLVRIPDEEFRKTMPGYSAPGATPMQNVDPLGGSFGAPVNPAPVPGPVVAAPPPPTQLPPEPTSIQDAPVNGREGQPSSLPTPDTLPSTPSSGGGIATLTERQSVQSNPADVKEAKDHLDAMIADNNATAKLSAADKKAQAKELQRRSQMLQADIDKHNRVEAERQQALAAKQADIDNDVKTYASMKLDPTRLWSSMGTGDRVLAGFAMALGAIGSAGNGGKPNAALAVLDQAIDRDIDAQKVNMDKAGKNVELRRTLYNDLRNKYNDEQLARNALKEIVYNKLAAEADKRAATSQSAIIKANAKTVGDELRYKASQAQLERNKIVVTNKDVALPAAKPRPANERVTTTDEDKETRPMEESIKSLTDFHQYLKNVKASDFGPVDKMVNTIKTKFGMEVDPAIVKASQQGNFVAKAYLHYISGAGVTDKEFVRTITDMLGDMGQDKNVALGRVENMTNNMYKNWDGAMQHAMRSSRYNPEVVNYYNESKRALINQIPWMTETKVKRNR